MSKIKLLNQKIAEINSEIERLDREYHIDPLKASAADIIQNDREQQQARDSAAHLKEVVAGLERQLKQQEAQEAAAAEQQLVTQNFSSLEQQADVVLLLSQELQSEIEKLRTMGRSISAKHQQRTRRMALDDRLPVGYQLPKVEKLKHSIIIHSEQRNLIG